MTPLKVLILSLALLGCTAYGCVVNIAMQPGAVSVYIQPQSNVWTTDTPETTPTQPVGLPTLTPVPTVTPPPQIDLACNRELSGGLNIRAERSTDSTIVDRLNLNECAIIVFSGTDTVQRPWLWVCIQTVTGECNEARQGYLAGWARFTQEVWRG